MPATSLKLEIEQGKTFEKVLHWETEPFITVPIAGITQAASVRVTTPTPHGLPNGWRVAVVDAKGMLNLNASSNPPVDEDMRRGTVIDGSTIEFNGLSSAAWKAHTAGTGYLQFYTPHDLADYTARMQIKGKVGDAVALIELTTENGGIDINETDKSITLNISATQTADIATWKKGVYDLELVSPSEFVTALFKGAVTVIPEITT